MCVVTASGKGQLKQLPMAKLKKYAKAYNIDVAGVIEKDDFIDRLVAARVSETTFHSIPRLLVGKPHPEYPRVAPEPKRMSDCIVCRHVAIDR